MSRPSDTLSRRRALARSLGLAAGSGLALAGCARAEQEKGGVSAVEDLMREHGVLRRILVIYRETAATLSAGGGGVDLAALGEATSLFQTFGEVYHERNLEEQHIFPAVRKAGGGAAALIDTLLLQHQRGRDLSAFIKAGCAAGGAAASDLPAALTAFARMYEAHAAFEDTIVFQAWKTSMSDDQRRGAAEQFEQIEHAQFKGDGFDQAVAEVARIEAQLGLADLAHYTPAPASAAG